MLCVIMNLHFGHTRISTFTVRLYVEQAQFCQLLHSRDAFCRSLLTKQSTVANDFDCKRQRPSCHTDESYGMSVRLCHYILFFIPDVASAFERFDPTVMVVCDVWQR